MIKKDSIVEQDYKIGSPIHIKGDGYNLTIAANLTKTCSPDLLNYCISKTFMIFLTQSFIAFFFFWDFMSLDKFQPIEINLTAVRIIFALLL